MKNNVFYFVEGKCEVALLQALKESPEKIIPGKIKEFNLIQKIIPKSILISIRPETKVVFVFDTDVPVTQQLRNNINQVKKFCPKVEIVFLPQVKNLEDELERCTDVSRVSDLTQSASKKDFKRDFCAKKNCRAILDRHNLDVSKLWMTTPPNEFSFISSNGDKIKVKV